MPPPKVQNVSSPLIRSIKRGKRWNGILKNVVGYVRFSCCDSGVHLWYGAATMQKIKRE
jgi:hypothetical protein